MNRLNSLRLLSVAWDDFIKMFTWVIQNLCAVQPFNSSLLCINFHLSGWLRLCLLLSCIDENSMYFVLSSLKTKLFCKTQSNTVCRFDSNFSIQFCRFFNLQCWYNVVSSAYCKELQLVLSTMSIMYMLKSTRPSMLPCGIPKLLSWVDEVLSSICTYCRRSEV